VTILLTGATGFIGSEVVRQLAAAGQQTRVMTRRPSEPYSRLFPTMAEGTAQLAREAAGAGVRHMVYGSSMLVYDGSTTIGDDTAASPALAYGQAKLDAEAALTRTTEAGGPTVASIRLPHVAGTVLGRRGPTMVSADTIKGWNLSLRLMSGRLWSELDLVPRCRGVLEGIAARLDGFVAFRWRHPVFDRS